MGERPRARTALFGRLENSRLMRCAAALGSRFCGKRGVLRERTIGRSYGLTAFSARSGGEVGTLGEAARFGRHALPAQPRDFALPLGVHRGEAAFAFRRVFHDSDSISQKSMGNNNAFASKPQLWKPRGLLRFRRKLLGPGAGRCGELSFEMSRVLRPLAREPNLSHNAEASSGRVLETTAVRGAGAKCL